MVKGIYSVKVDGKVIFKNTSYGISTGEESACTKSGADALELSLRCDDNAGVSAREV
jgi:hypothetical protein